MSHDFLSIDMNGVPAAETGQKYELKTPDGHVFKGEFMDYGFETTDGIIIDVFNSMGLKYREIIAIDPDGFVSPVDLTDLKNTLKEYMSYVASDNYHEDNDFKQYIFESALKTFYGEDIFNKLNKLH